ASNKFPNIKNLIPNFAIFEGSPGTGKTTEAKIIGKYLGYPFIYIPINAITTKWYGESEAKLNNIFEITGEIAKEHGGAVLMIDEIDEIGANRDNSHEATGRVTGVLLKKLDGFEKVDNILLLASTNRMDKLDSALVSRSSLNINFRNPNTNEIESILNHYIPNLGQLSEDGIKVLNGKSGRDLSNLAKDFVSKLLKQNLAGDFDNTDFINTEFKNFIKNN
ncbi:MAG: AAA family ATPase, partial [Candidatus Gracilibacteria bacterium]|nr:AAA family ATPase [Candidatus Gracilibacteria bacterium]